MATIDQFKANLIGGGPRANRFRVFIPRAGQRIEFLCSAAQIPPMTVGVVTVPFRGQNLKLAGDRTFDDWSVTIINDLDFSSRTALESWQQDVAALATTEAALNTDYLLSRAFVEQLHKDDSVLARYEFFNMFPISIGAIDLSSAEASDVETFETQFTFSHWERVL
jgi:hypothetical protein|tara:strand:- start:751 stop:1248 length:498 start_codon:yes stop_codon:yes gene_type:complete